MEKPLCVTCGKVPVAQVATVTCSIMCWLAFLQFVRRNGRKLA